MEFPYILYLIAHSAAFHAYRSMGNAVSSFFTHMKLRSQILLYSAAPNLKSINDYIADLK